MTDREILLSVDVENTGLIPGPFSMIALGVIAYDHDEIEVSRFRVNLKELEGSVRDPVTMAWWSEHPEAWAHSTKDPVDPALAMQSFDVWLSGLPGRPKLLGWPLPVDFMFIYWYYVFFLHKMPPFGYDGLDIKTFAMRPLGVRTFMKVSRTKANRLVGLPEGELSHDPVDDAERQAKLFFALRAFSTK